MPALIAASPKPAGGRRLERTSGGDSARPCGPFKPPAAGCGASSLRRFCCRPFRLHSAIPGLTSAWPWPGSVWSAARCGSGNGGHKRDLLAFAMAVFFLVLLASSALAVFYSGLDVAAGSLVRVLLFGIPVYVFFYSAHGPGAGDASKIAWRGARRLYWFGLLSAAFACVDFYYQFPAPAGYGPQFIWLDSGIYRRAQGVLL